MLCLAFQTVFPTNGRKTASTKWFLTSFFKIVYRFFVPLMWRSDLNFNILNQYLTRIWRVAGAFSEPCIQQVIRLTNNH